MAIYLRHCVLLNKFPTIRLTNLLSKIFTLTLRRIKQNR